MDAVLMMFHIFANIAEIGQMPVAILNGIPVNGRLESKVVLMVLLRRANVSKLGRNSDLLNSRCIQTQPLTEKLRVRSWSKCHCIRIHSHGRSLRFLRRNGTTPHYP